MQLDTLWLTDYRNYTTFELSLSPGLLVVVGDNGAGKSNLLEAIGFAATLSSFRGATNDVLVRTGASQAVVRGEGERASRRVLVEAEVKPAGRVRVTLNRQPLRRAQDLADSLRVSVFSPDDLTLVKSGPTGRRRYLDDTLTSLHPRHDAARRSFERVLRQRNALLAQVSGHSRHLSAEETSTLDVWNTRLAEAGELVGEARAELVARLEPALAKAYAQLSGSGLRGPNAMTGLRGPNAMTGLRGPNAVPGLVTAIYDAPWRPAGLAAALAAARVDEFRRGVTQAGPHRDDLSLSIGGLPARTHASQGEQRTLALALRLAVHDLVTEVIGEPPILLLDDVFSELDDSRSRALLDAGLGGQTVLTTTGPVPAGAPPARTIRLAGGRIVEDLKP